MVLESKRSELATAREQKRIANATLFPQNQDEDDGRVHGSINPIYSINSREKKNSK